MSGRAYRAGAAVVAELKEFDFAAELVEPSPQGWHRCAKRLDELWEAAHNAVHVSSFYLLQSAVETCRQAIQQWPTAARQAVPREPLEHWRRSQRVTDFGHDALLDLCLIVHETKTYDYYCTYVCNDSRLLWPGGEQRCHLARGFTGAARGMKSKSWLNIGEPGQGDFPGWFSVQLPKFGRMALKLEVEIKMPTGRLSPGQLRRRDELARAGALYISARSVGSIVGQLVAFDLALIADGMQAGLRAIEEWREQHSW